MTEREKVLAQRAAFRAGYEIGRSLEWSRAEIAQGIDALTCQRYPLPKVTRPRIERDPQRTVYGPASGFSGDLYWSVRSGRIIPVTQNGVHITEWEEDQTRDSYPTANRVKLWADLLANPTEEVEDDG